MKIAWTTAKRKINELIPYRQNPRKMSKEDAQHLMQSLEKFDYVELVAINQDNTIIAGHMRINALKKLGRGKEEIDVRLPSRMLTEDECREYIIRSNRNVGSWDWEELASSFDLNQLHEWGFSSEELVDHVLDADIGKDDDKEEECEKCGACGQKIKNKSKD